MSGETAGVRPFEFAFGAAAFFLVVGAALYLWGWSLETSPPADIGFSSIEEIRQQTDRLREVAGNIALQSKLLWWGDRSFVAAIICFVGALYLKHRAAQTG